MDVPVSGRTRPRKMARMKATLWEWLSEQNNNNNARIAGNNACSNVNNNNVNNGNRFRAVFRP